MTSFQKKVYKTVKAIPRGEVKTYKEIAAKIGSPKAQRAVGSVLAKNKNPNIPCHRIVRSDGRIGGYNKGKRKKRLLLKKEGVKIMGGKVVL